MDTIDRLNWIEFINSHLKNEHQRFRYEPPASETNISDLEVTLNRVLPAELKSLYRAANGVIEQMRVADEGWVDIQWLMRPIEGFISPNLGHQHTELKQDQLVFADPGTDGLLFITDLIEEGFNPNGRNQCPVYLYNPLNQSTNQLHKNLKGFLGDWLSGRVAV